MHAVSRTAVYVAAGRAVGAREPDSDVRNPDFLAEKFLGEDLSAFDLDLPIVRALKQSYDDAMQDIEVASTVRAMTVRTRFIDDVLERAVAAGARQLLVLGAGLDSHAYRCTDLLRGVRVFEADRGVTQEWKRRRVDEVLGGPPDNLTYVAVDFQTDNLRDVLGQHGYDFGVRTCVIMEGLTMYLTEPALRDTLELVASHPAGTSVVFDFVSDILVGGLKQFDITQAPEAARPYMQNFLHMIRDEPWEFGFPFGKEREYLLDLGLDVSEILMLASEEASSRYLTRADGTELAAEQIRRMPQAPEQTEAAQKALAYRIAEVVVRPGH